jgi:hypothetical protein
MGESGDFGRSPFLGSSQSSQYPLDRVSTYIVSTVYERTKKTSGRVLPARRIRLTCFLQRGRGGSPPTGKIGGRTPIRSVDLSGPQQGQHLRRWTYCLASRRTVFKQLEQFAGVLAGKLSSNRFVGDQWNELRIDLAASNKRRRPDEPLFGDAQSGMAHCLRLNDCGAAISKRKHPESH